MTTTQAALLDALTDLASALSSLNSGPSHAIQVTGERVYWQREEWVRWILDEKLPEARAAIAQAEAAAEAAQPEPVAWRLNYVCDATGETDTTLHHIQPSKMTELPDPPGCGFVLVREAPLYAAPPQPAPIAAQAAPTEPVTMPSHWSVSVTADGDTLVSIGNDWLSGSRDLTDEDERVIIGAAQHLLSFVGYGLPPGNFDPDADDAAQAGPAQAPLTEAWPDLRAGIYALRREAAAAFEQSSSPGYKLHDLYRAKLDDILAAHRRAPAASTRPADASISGQRVDMVPSDDDESGFPCPNCQGSGAITVMSDNGPDAHEVEECCPHCDGRGSLDAAYEGAVKLLKAQRAETLKLSGKLWGLKHSREAREAFLLEVGEDLARWHDPIGYWKDFAARKALAAAPQAPAEPAAQAVGQGATLPVHEVWREGYRITGESDGAVKLGEAQADTFEEACDIVCRGKADYDAKTRRVWGCRLFNNEADARRLFG